jgi:hypothetical protein
MITAEQNLLNMQNVAINWRLGPTKTSILPDANSEYWSGMAAVWAVPEVEARSMLCANCEYYNNTKDMMLEMNSIPLNEFDMDGGGRGFCEKFDFICHNLRTCQAWETKYYEEMDEEILKSIEECRVKIKGL